jgi:hypothetical protein
MTTMPPLHPTILIGCGAYGQQVLTSLLTKAATHGRLTWEDPPGAAGPSDRRLRDLCLIWTPTVVGVSEAVSRFDESSDLLQDLHRQIARVDPDGDVEAQIVAAVSEAKAHLLDVRRRENAARLRLGLDVFVLAQPCNAAALGALERLLAPAMSLLASDTSLLRSAQGGDLLNVNLILDFDHYWAAAAPGVELRREVGLWLEQMAQPPGPGFSRIYFSDRYTTDGSRSDEQRLAETVLFLEFLLFEGLRSDENLRVLYQKERDDRAQRIGSFGIRLMERSSGLLSRVAAAHFADHWLDYLASDRHTPHGQGLSILRAWLDDYRPERLRAAIDERQFLAIADQELAALEQELLKVPVEDAAWPTRVEAAAEVGMRRLRRNLLERARERARVVTEAKLGGLAERMTKVITQALHHPAEPERIGSVLREIRELDRSLHEPLRIEAAEAPAHGEPLVTGLTDVHARYVHLRRDQVDAERLRYWWPLLAATVAAGLTPFAMETVQSIMPIDPDLPGPVRQVLELIATGVTPVLAALLLGIAGWLVCHFGFSRAVRGRIQRAIAIFTDGSQGRLTDRIRWAVRNGPIRRTAESHARQVFRETAMRVDHEVRVQTGRILRALERRVLEMRWLRNQMREYLRSHGVDVVPSDRALVLRIDDGNLRHWIDLRDDISVLLKHNPPTPERFQSTQATLQPFVRWSEIYADAFLRPVVFLDRLSQIYERPEERRLQSRDDRAREELVGSVMTLMRTRAVDRFHPGFTWAPSGEAPGTARRYAVVPSSWQGLPGLSPLLQEHDWTQVQSATTGDRLFFVQVQFGPPPDPA